MHFHRPRAGVAAGAIALALTLGVDPLHAQITVPPGFVVEQLSGRIDNKTPRIEAIRNPAYGTGVVAASVVNQILTVRRIDAGQVAVVASFPVSLAGAYVNDLRVDGVGVQNNRLFVIINKNTFETSIIYRIDPDGTVTPVVTIGDAGDALSFTFDFTTGLGGYTPGAYLEDVNGNQGSSLWFWSTSDVFSRLAQNSVPAGRADLDIRGVEFDRTGVFNNRLVLVDNDANQSGINAVYTLSPSLQWQMVGAQQSLSTMYYRDMSISPGGAFGQFLYLLDARLDRVIRMDGAGALADFATGFTVVSDYDDTADGAASISMNNDGSVLYVSDTNGVYRIREAGVVPGPTIVMREPSMPPPGTAPFTNPEGVSSTRILWSAAVNFVPADITVIRQSDGAPVPFAASGSGSAFMIIAFGQTLLNDTYTITINDTVVSTVGGAAIDGDSNGLAGGDAVIVLTHGPCDGGTGCDADWDNNGVVNSTDVSSFINDWFEDIFKGCGG
jgi:hypothetical protein